jgi:hypothetical protein
MKYFIFLCLFMPITLIAQQSGRMETDRPDQTESPYLTKKHFLQAEIGFNTEKHNGLKTLVHPTALWKYGLTTKFELRLTTELETQELPFFISPSIGYKKERGLLPIEVGGKLLISEEKGLLPKTSLIFHVGLPKVASAFFKASKLAPNFRFVMQNSINENIGIGYNLGAEWDGESNKPYWIYTFAPGFNLGKKWYGYVEVFGEVRKSEKPAHALDGGIAYYFSDNTKIDFSAGFGISKAAVDHYAAIGFSFRLPVKAKK